MEWCRNQIGHPSNRGTNAVHRFDRAKQRPGQDARPSLTCLDGLRNEQGSDLQEDFLIPSTIGKLLPELQYEIRRLQIQPKTIQSSGVLGM